MSRRAPAGVDTSSGPSAADPRGGLPVASLADARDALYAVLQVLRAGGARAHQPGIEHALGIADDDRLTEESRALELRMWLRRLPSGPGSLDDLVLRGGDDAPEEAARLDALDDTLRAQWERLQRWARAT